MRHDSVTSTKQRATTINELLRWSLKLKSLDEPMYKYLCDNELAKWTAFGVLSAGCMSHGCTTNNWAESCESLTNIHVKKHCSCLGHKV